MKLADFDTLTFDCYGTLIDWESGIAAALEPLAARAGRQIDADERVAAFGRHEHEEQARTPEALYPEILAGVHAAIARDWGVDPDPELARAFGGSVPDWPAFPDSAEALRYLKRHYRLVVLSNVHRAGFAASNEKLEVEFDAIYTAEDIGSYKPDPRNFHYMLEHLERDFGVAKDRILHTAESLFHDCATARSLGLATAWIHRRAEAGGSGATRAVEESPQVDFYFTSLAAMADAHRSERAERDGGGAGEAERMSPRPSHIDEVLGFWFQELSSDDWFRGGEAVDNRIRERFLALHEALRSHVPESWRTSARGMLAAVIALDQFPRNLYRDDPRAFAADATALGLAKEAIERGFDREMSKDERRFLYLPFEHSEDSAEQARSVALFATLDDEDTLGYAVRHQEIVDRFGRFPHRNKALGRESTPEEIEFLKEPNSSF